MISAVNIKEIKRKVYSAHFEDGLWDILLGVFIMVISASGGPILWPGVLPLFCYTVGYLGISRIRQVTTYPRTGYVKNPEKRRVPVILVMLIIDIIVIILIGLLQDLGSGVRDWFFNFQRVQSAIRFAVLLTFVAYRFMVKHWYLYAVLIILWMVLWLFMQDWIRPLLGRHAAYRWQEYYQFYVMGGIILLAGIMIFVRFLRNNPKMELEELDG